MSENPTILYVEDNPDNRMLVRRILMVEDFRVVEAENPQKALEVAKTLRPDLILMDINLPDMDGLTLTAHLREYPNLDGVPIIALTANVMRGDRERTLEAGCDGYIQKPVDVDLLPEQIRKFIQEAQLGY
jgi:two-component system cell cycle response regulator DivK